jgi:3-oxoacyl-[acyl-carrier-protein] synthase-1
MNRTVHVIALAAQTPVGHSAEMSAASIRAGISRVGQHPFFIDPAGEPLMCAHYPLLAPSTLVLSRMKGLASRALREVVAKLGRPPVGGKVPLLLTLPEERPGMGGATVREIVAALSVESLPDGWMIAPRELGLGHAGGFLGLNQAVQWISGGQVELCLVGGVDSYMDPDTIDWLDAGRRLARDGSRGGFPPGEGAAIIALASEGFRKQAGLPSLAVVRGVACTKEMRDENAPEGVQGEALTDAYLQVGAHLAGPGERFDDFYCDVNNERSRTTDLAFALLRAGHLFRDTAYVATAGSIGDVGAATVPLNVILAARAWTRGYSKGKTALVSGASWAGIRGAALLHKGG